MHIVEIDFLDKTGDRVFFRASPSIDDAERVATSLLTGDNEPPIGKKPVKAVIHGGPTLELGKDGRIRKSPTSRWPRYFQ